jgi:hypothetical protein
VAFGDVCVVSRLEVFGFKAPNAEVVKQKDFFYAHW